jgi:hypothetical protein
MADNPAGPCPVCGSLGDVPDGIHDVADETIRVAALSAYSRDLLERVAQVLVQARRDGADPEQVGTDVEETGAPEFAGRA